MSDTLTDIRRAEVYEDTVDDCPACGHDAYHVLLRKTGDVVEIICRCSGYRESDEDPCPCEYYKVAAAP